MFKSIRHSSILDLFATSGGGTANSPRENPRNLNKTSYSPVRHPLPADTANDPIRQSATTLFGGGCGGGENKARAVQPSQSSVDREKRACCDHRPNHPRSLSPPNRKDFRLSLKNPEVFHFTGMRRWWFPGFPLPGRREIRAD